MFWFTHIQPKQLWRNRFDINGDTFRKNYLSIKYVGKKTYLSNYFGYDRAWSLKVNTVSW